MNKYEEAAKKLDQYYENNIEAVKKEKRYTDKELEELFSDFQREYAPAQLKKIEPWNILDEVFDPEGKEYSDDSMVAKLIEEGKDSSYGGLGHVGKRTNNLMLYKSNGTWKMGKGFKDSGTELTYEEAERIAYSKLNQMCDVLISIPEGYFDTFEGYMDLSEKLAKILPVHAWVHKYLHMIYPYAFSEFQTAEYKKTVLELLEIEPEDDQILMAGQIAEITRRMKHNQFYEVACTVYSIPGLREYFKKGNKTSLLTLREELKKGSRKPLVVQKKPEDIIDEAKYVESVNECKLKDEYPQTYEPVPEKKKELENGSSSKKYPRDPVQGQIALRRAGYKCEIDKNHWSFIRDSDKNTYMEAHHLIPVSQHDLFGNSLDVPANIVSLCSNCHNCIHYGTADDKRKMLYIIFNQRKEELKKTGLEVTFEELLKMYI